MMNPLAIEWLWCKIRSSFARLNTRVRIETTDARKVSFDLWP